MSDPQNIFLYQSSILILSFALIGIVSKEKGLTDLSIAFEDHQDPAAIVEMTNTMKFTPDTVTINVGETVQWKNTSLIAHSVTGDPSRSTIDSSV